MAWGRKDGSTHIAVPIAGRHLEEVRAWLAENCRGDFLVVLGQRVLFERREDAALTVVTFCWPLQRPASHLTPGRWS